MRNPWKIFSEWSDKRWLKHGLKKWERTRAKGKIRFALEFAIFMALFVTIFSLIWSWVETNGWSIRGNIPPNFLRDVLIKPIAWFVGGYITGVLTWNQTEKDYLRLKERQNGEGRNLSS